MHEIIQCGSYVAIRLPSDLIKVIEIQPNTSVSLGKFGSFQASHLIGRPYHLTYEILEKPLEDGGTNLRVVPASELNEIALGDGLQADGALNGAEAGNIEVVNDDGTITMRTNQHITDDGISQRLTIDEIEELKKADVSGGKDIVAKLLESHSGLDKKTAFSLAKYTLRKTKKYMKRFTALPLDVPLLVSWLVEDKDAPRIMEMRLETLSLITSWANVHWSTTATEVQEDDPDHDSNRWLVVDEVSGILVAALAERMGILYPEPVDSKSSTNGDASAEPVSSSINGVSESAPQSLQINTPAPNQAKSAAQLKQEARIHTQEQAMSAKTNTITLVHQNIQPNTSLLTYFGYDTANPNTQHPLYTNLKEISFLQLLQPENDYAYLEPSSATEEQIKLMKSRQKSSYYRKQRRWQRTKSIVEETQAGGFAGLVVASTMNPASVLHPLVPLLRGGAQVVVYSPTVEPLTELMDCYSKARRTVYTQIEDPVCPSEEFPVDPRLLIGASLYTARSRPWQVLPGRTHPKMTGRGGSEGYIFVGTRVHPVEGKVEARGARKRRKLDAGSGGVRTPGTDEADIKNEAMATEPSASVIKEET